MEQFNRKSIFEARPDETARLMRDYSKSLQFMLDSLERDGAEVNVGSRNLNRHLGALTAALNGWAQEVDMYYKDNVKED